MLPGTPNERHLDRFVRDLRTRYAPRRIEAWSEAERRAARRAVATEVARFVGSFPDDGGPPDDGVRPGASAPSVDGSPGRAAKRPLSAFERRRLARVESETRRKIDRLLGAGDESGGRLRRATAALRTLLARGR
jgi:hypothetical protein